MPLQKLQVRIPSFHSKRSYNTALFPSLDHAPTERDVQSDVKEKIQDLVDLVKKVLLSVCEQVIFGDGGKRRKSS
jgi:hypothetical protein